MGTLTHQEIVKEALQLAGNSGLTTRAQVWLGLIRRTLFEKVTLPQNPNTKAVLVKGLGATSFVIGGGAGDELTDIPVRGIKKCMVAENVSPVLGWTNMVIQNPSNWGTDAANNSARTGRPSVLLVEPDAGGNGWECTISPAPDREYRFLLTVDARGPDVATYSASVVNDWPDDMTVIQGVYALALKQMKEETAAQEWTEFLRMRNEDRVRYMGMSDENSKWNLSRRTYGENRAQSRQPWDWMGPV